MKRLALLFVFILSLFIFCPGCEKASVLQETLRLDSLNQGGTAIDRFTIVGNDLSVVNNQAIKLYNIQNASSPVYESSTQMQDAILSLRSYKDSLLVPGTMNTGLVLYGIKNTNTLYQVLNANIGMQVYDPFAWNSNYLYTIQNTNSYSVNGRYNLIVYDMNNSVGNVFNSSLNLYFPKDISIDSNNNLFVCDSGLKVFDVSDVNNINITKHFNIEANKIVAYNHNLFILGNSGLFQYHYNNGSLALISKIDIVPVP